MEHQIKNLEINQRRAIATPRGIGVICIFYVARAESATLWDVERGEFTDFAAGTAVVNTGHRHPRVTAAIAAQLESFSHICYQVVPYTSALRSDAADPVALSAPLKEVRR